MLLEFLHNNIHVNTQLIQALLQIVIIMLIQIVKQDRVISNVPLISFHANRKINNDSEFKTLQERS